MTRARAPRTSERRRRRSPHASEALHLQLCAAASRHALDMVILADRRGNVWASSRPASGADDLSRELREAIAHEEAQRADPADQSACAEAERARTAAPAPELTVFPFQVGPAPLFLAARGPEGSPLHRTAAGVTRILERLL